MFKRCARHVITTFASFDQSGAHCRTDSCSALVRAFISSRLDYCNRLLTGIDKSQVNKLQSILRVAARLVMRKGKFESIPSDIRDKLHWLPIQQRIKFKIGVLIYRCLRGTAPPYLSEMLSAAADIAGRRSLRYAAHGDLIVPCSRTVRFGSRMFAVSGPTIWELVDKWTRKFQFNWTCF